MSLKIFVPVVCIVVFLLSLSNCSPVKLGKALTIVSRQEWGGRPPTSIQKLQTPVPTVVIHHSSVPGACYTRAECSAAMRSMQNTHQNVNKWADIGYNFAVGSDGAVYEGRGWDRVGAHATGVNSQSIGIVLIGHWVSQLPPKRQLDTTQELISEGVRRGFIRPQYSLMGHREVSSTECPGEALFREIGKWRHFTNKAQF